MDLKELANDEAFKESLANAKDYDEVIELFKAKGIEVTEEMLKASEAAVTPEGELSEGALEGVAGGRIIILWPLWPPIGWPRWPRW